MHKRLIVMSVDALVYEDLEYLETLPSFKKFMANGSRIKRVRTIYPTITYPAHVSIATGTYPNRHGVINNEELHIGEMSSAWNWFHDVVKTPDIFDAAKKAGLTTAAVFWPVTGNHESIDYLVDEYWPQFEGDTPHDVFTRSGTTEDVYEKTVKKYMPGLKIRSHPDTDDFVVNCACDIIREYKPNLLMLHPANIDGFRHETGLFSSEVTQGLNDVEKWLSQLITATKNAGVYEETNFIVISDHGQLNITRILHPNVLLKEAGFIRVNENNELLEWDAYCKSAAMSAHVYLHNPSDKDMYNRVYSFLCRLRDEQVYGISEVFTTQEINENEHLSGDFSFVLETDGFTSFGNDWCRPLVRSFDITDYRFGRATHGHLPDKGPQPVFLACGPQIRKGVVLEREPIVNEAPTFAKILGVELPTSDGVCLDSILRL